ncbi:MAG: penicillin-binding transpeptidase domain-containing protein [Verrucomicrobiota bacterium]|nr:penicillin-binding transpeptidase domain-containing protein [Verrucomicrobiota bacterium]
MFIFDQLRSKEIPIRVMTIFILCCMFLLAASLWRLQVASGSDFRDRQQNQSIRTVRLPATRGHIVDRHRQPLAMNRLRFDVHMYIDELRPLFYTHYMRLKAGRRMSRPEQDELGRKARYQVVSNLTMQVSLRLGQPLVLDKEKFHNHYYKRRYTPMAVIPDLSPDQVARFVEQIHSVPGVDLSVNPVRTYPNDDMAFHTLGYLRRDDNPDSEDGEQPRFRYRLPDYVGVDGLEGVYDGLLRGVAGGKSIRVNNISYRTSEEIWAWPESGHDMVLSIDRDIQLAAEAELQANGPETRGAVVVMEPNTGDLLALVSLPGFDSNKFISGFSRAEITQLNDERLNRWLNRATGSGGVAYPPGSIFKLISSVAYLEEGLLNPENPVYNPGYFRNQRLYPHYSLDDTAPPGDYDFIRAFKRSSNTYFIHYALTPDGRTDRWRQGKRVLLKWGNRFRLGQKTLTSLPGGLLSPIREGRGYFPARGNELKRTNQFGDKVTWAPGDVANLCIGQGEITVTPLQMAVMTSAVANGGKVLQPRLVTRVDSRQVFGQAQNQVIPVTVHEDLNLKPETVELLHRAMLADVADRDGSGRAARVSGLAIGGKTGTAQVKVPTGKFNPRTDVRLFRTDHITWFVSFAPVESPRYTVVVMVESGESGASTCAPIAGRIYHAIRDLERQRKNGGPRLAKR